MTIGIVDDKDNTRVKGFCQILGLFSSVNNLIFYALVQLAERMSEMEAESLAKLVELEGELVELRRQKEELENVNSQVRGIFLWYAIVLEIIF